MKGNRSAKKSELSEQVTEMLENEVDSNPNGEKVLANEGAKNGNPQENALVQGVENPQDDNTMSMKNGNAIDNKPEDKQVVWVPVEMLDPHSNHVFKIRNDDAMSDLVENIRQHGVVAPILVREKNTGRYEIISGHRRALASRLLGLDTVPVIVMDLDDDQAELLMVDTNLRQRASVAPSERGKAYKVKMEIFYRQRHGSSTEQHPRQVGEKLSVTQTAEAFGTSERQVHRFLRLNYLIDNILDYVDSGRMGLTTAVELSYLSEDEQRELIKAIRLANDKLPSLTQAKRIRETSGSEDANSGMMTKIIIGEKTMPKVESIMFLYSDLSSYFPKDTSAEEMKKTIIELLRNRLQ